MYIKSVIEKFQYKCIHYHVVIWKSIACDNILWFTASVYSFVIFNFFFYENTELSNKKNMYIPRKTCPGSWTFYGVLTGSSFCGTCFSRQRHNEWKGGNNLTTRKKLVPVCWTFILSKYKSKSFNTQSCYSLNFTLVFFIHNVKMWNPLNIVCYALHQHFALISIFKILFIAIIRANWFYDFSW
jgi:hypothetical protein